MEGSEACWETILCGQSRHTPRAGYSQYLPTTLHSFMNFLQEISLSAAFGIPDSCGVRGFCDEQVGATLVNPCSPKTEIEIGMVDCPWWQNWEQSGL